MNVTVTMALKAYLNIPTIGLSNMTERNGYRQMLEHALSIVIKPRSSSADPSVTGKSVTFHSCYYTYRSPPRTIPSFRKDAYSLLDFWLHILNFSSHNHSLHLPVISIWAFPFLYCLAYFLSHPCLVHSSHMSHPLKI
jgi:hypothetical protein